MDASDSEGHEKATVEEAGAMGGKARAESLTAEERKEIAKKAAAARWHSNVLKATHGSVDHPLLIGDISIPCYVLENGQRVIVQSGMIEALGMAKGGSSHKGGTRLAKFVSGDRLKSFVNEELVKRTQEPIRFQTTMGLLAFGFEASILADICEAVLEAKKRGVLQAQQEHIAERCWILYRGFARVGIIALIDEATGYQADRARDALAKILEAFVAKELRKWVKTFPVDFYKELFRLRGLNYGSGKVKKPSYIGHLTNDLVYARLAPGVLKELRERNPVTESGYRKGKHHQWLTEDIGHPKLLQHLSAVIALMKVTPDRDWDGFKAMLDKALPKQIELPLFDHLDDEKSGD